MISLIHPSRSRPWKSKQAMIKWHDSTYIKEDFEIIISLDLNDGTLPQYLHYFEGWGHLGHTVMSGNNDSAINAINRGAKEAKGDILMVISEDTEPFDGWDLEIMKVAIGKTDFILKTQDGIQKYIITNPIMDRAYYNRFGYIYHPDFQHLFCDTWLTVMADITGRKITSDLMFKHNHYSVNGTPPDELHKRNDATWKQGEETFIKLLKTLSPEDLKKIDDPSMRNWIRNKGIRV